jgi:uncharacterized protein YjiS (DUF1127 family)
MEKEMTALDFTPAHRATHSLGVRARRVVTAIAAWFAARRAAHDRRLTLRSLLEMDACRLDDLGITPQDVLEALGRKAPKRGL